MAKSIGELKNIHGGKDVFVLGSGKSLDFIPKSFFDGRITIGVNFLFRDYDLTYSMGHHHQVMQEPIDKGFTVVTSEYATCVLQSGIKGFRGPYPHYNNLHGEYYYYKHGNQLYGAIDLSYFDKSEHLTAGGTIVTTAIHFAYYLGARTIWLCGVDCGLIDGCINYVEYCNPTNRNHPSGTQRQLAEISNHIRKKGVPVVSINPFVGFNFEGHKFTK